MTSYFSEKKILITGASQGLGRELALQLLKNGGQVLALSRDNVQLETLSREVESLLPAATLTTWVCDVTDREQTALVFKEIENRFGALDIVILNAGIKHENPGVLNCDKIRETMDVNFSGALRCVELTVPAMIRNGQGQLVFISSLGAYHGMIAANGYNASKAALSIFAESLRLDFAKNRNPILVTVVKPGLIDTAMMQNPHNKAVMMVPKEKAAALILKGIEKQKNEICFPRLMHWVSILMGLLPKKFQWFVFNRVKARDI